uniref:Uncharacterized protein n=1 Tax=Leviviridae sp. TaxID=2027243 RepID=A0A514DCQ9_9VIRU|nr:MAG: hypothetical protein H2BulkLitter11614_000003 [Leviviridae sp.]
MPNMADIVVKKADGSTDITFTQVVAAAGDKSPAVWRSNSVGSAAGFHPELRCSSRQNGTNTARVVDLSYSYPSLVTSTDTGTTSVSKRFNVTLSASLPLEMPQTDIDEAAAQLTNLIDSTLIVSVLKAGYAPV